MFSTLRVIWLRVTASSYTRVLENENARLRAENRALLNSILGIAGIPPLRVDVGIERQRRRDLSIAANVRKGGPPSDGPYGCQLGDSAADNRDSQGASVAGGVSLAAPSADETRRVARAKGLVVPANPLRRRSWQQIGRMLEIENARRAKNRDNSDAML